MLAAGPFVFLDTNENEEPFSQLFELIDAELKIERVGPNHNRGELAQKSAISYRER